MKFIKNNEISPEQIKFLRKNIINDTPDVKNSLGINSRNIVEMLPIMGRNFQIWIACIDNDIVGSVTFTDGENDSKFIKSLYVLREFRNKGYGKKIIQKLVEDYKKLELKINQGNESMYKLAMASGIRGEKRDSLLSEKMQESYPIWWSNYKEDDFYE